MRHRSLGWILVLAGLAGFAGTSCGRGPDRRPPSHAAGGQKQVLVVLFVPGVEGDGKTAIDQDHWTKEALEFFGRTFGGATAFPRGRGVWRDDERGGALVFEETVVLHAYVRPDLLDDPAKQDALRAFCRRLARETRQREVGVVIGDEYVGVGAESPQ